MFRKIIGAVLGLVVAFVLIQRSEILVYRLYSPSRGTDMSDFNEYLARTLEGGNGLPVTALLLVLSCQLMGTLAGTFAAARVGRSAVPGYVVGAFVLYAAMANPFLFQKPQWFSLASFVIIIVMTLAGTRLGFSLSARAPAPDSTSRA